MEESIKRHIEDRASFRIISKRLSEWTHGKFGRMTVHRALIQACQDCKNPVEIAKELKPQWNGWLHLDGKGIKVKGESGHAWTAFIAQDATGDIVHQILLEGGENRAGITGFLKVIRDEIHYPVQGVISDLGPEIIWAVQAVWPGIPHQGCVTHTLRLIDDYADYKSVRRQLRRQLRTWKEYRGSTPILHRQSAWYKAGIQAIRRKIKTIKQTHITSLRLRRRARIWLSSPSSQTAEERWKRFQRASTRARLPRERALVQSLRNHRRLLTIHLDHPGMPRTNNRIENLMKQLNRRLKTIEGFGGPKTARGYLNLWSIYHRFKPYTDCRGPHRHKNGKAPLECAGVDLTGLDWLKFSQNSNT